LTKILQVANKGQFVVVAREIALLASWLEAFLQQGSWLSALEAPIHEKIRRIEYGGSNQLESAFFEEERSA
jgi:hypothetical protein